MKKVLKNTAKTKSYLESLPKIYALFLWAKFGILELPWTGKYNNDGMPLVYIYCDGNGMYDEFYLDTVNNASSGGFYNWYTNKEYALFMQERLNNRHDHKLLMELTTMRST